MHEHQLTHVPTNRAAQRAESVSAPSAPPSSATAMKTKRRKPSQLARESRLRKCFNCGERGHLSLECARPCYKCNIAGHHSARCPYSVNRAPGQEASSSSPSSVQSTPERPVRPTSGGGSFPSSGAATHAGCAPSRHSCTASIPWARLTHVEYLSAFATSGKRGSAVGCPEEEPECSCIQDSTARASHSLQTTGRPDCNNSWGFRCPLFYVCNTLGTEYGLVSGTAAARRRCLHGVLLSVRSCSRPKFNLNPGTATVILQHRAQCSASPYTCTRSFCERGGHGTECVLVQWCPGSEYVLLLDQGNFRSR